MTRYRFEVCPETADRHQTIEVYDEDGDVAFIGFDAHHRHWWIITDPDRFPSLASLPALFEGRFSLHSTSLDDVYRLFGVPLPDAAEPSRNPDQQAAA